MKIWGTEFHAGGIASAKVLRQEQPWCFQEDWFG